MYQSVLLSQKQPVRTVSMDESVQPNTSPAQWPGKSAKPNTEIQLPELKETKHIYCQQVNDPNQQCVCPSLQRPWFVKMNAPSPVVPTEDVNR